jgi:phage terminase large subunit-like protein
MGVPSTSSSEATKPFSEIGADFRWNPKQKDAGIVVAGIDIAGRGYVLADLSGQYTPEGWARAALKAYRDYSADRIVAERNYGGALFEANIRAVQRNAPVLMVTATRGKVVRAEPVSALYEQNRVVYVGSFPDMEDPSEGRPTGRPSYRERSPWPMNSRSAKTAR